MTEIDELQQAMDELAGVQLTDNTWQEAEVVRRDITGIIQALHRDLCTASADLQEREGLRFQIDQCKKSRERLKARATAAEAEAAGLRERLTDLQTAVEERDTELTMLREALDTIPLYEYGDAQREGCDPGGAWDCFKEALEEHISAVRSAPAVYDAKNDIADLRQQLATVTALVPEADWLEQAAVMAWHHCESCPVENNGCRGRKREDWTCKMLQAQLRNLATAIRAWRGDGGEEEG